MQTSTSHSHRGAVSARWLISTWLPPLIGVLLICGESTQSMGAEHTSRILRPLYQWLFGPISDASWGELHHYIRKSGHFCGYGTLTLVFLRAWYRTLCMKMQTARQGTANAAGSLSRIQIYSAAAALVSTFLVASGDEFHQTFVPGRTGLFSDVLLDTTGGLIFILLTWIVVRRRKTSQSGK